MKYESTNPYGNARTCTHIASTTRQLCPEASSSLYHKVGFQTGNMKYPRFPCTATLSVKRITLPYTVLQVFTITASSIFYPLSSFFFFFSSFPPPPAFPSSLFPPSSTFFHRPTFILRMGVSRPVRPCTRLAAVVDAHAGCT